MALVPALIILLLYSPQFVLSEFPACPTARIQEEVGASVVELPQWIQATGDNRTIELREGAPLSCVGTSLRQTFRNGTASGLRLLLSDGMILVEKQYYAPPQYCIDKLDEEELVVSYCKINCGDHATLCIPKCCPLSQLIKISKVGGVPSCSPSPTRWSPFIYSSPEDKLPKRPNLTQFSLYWASDWQGEGKEAIPTPWEEVHFQEEWEEEDGVLLSQNASYPSSPFKLLENGSLAVEGTGGTWELHHNNYCIDGLLPPPHDLPHHPPEDAPSRPRPPAYEGREQQQIVFLTSFFQEEEDPWMILRMFFVWVGVVFLLLTAVVYLLLWDKHNIHGWTIFSFVLSMLLFFLSLGTLQLVQLVEDERFTGTNTCFLIAIGSHFTFLLAISWLSVINFDFWATFRNLSPSGSNSSVRRYMAYLSFALAVPTLILLISLIIHFSVESPGPHPHNGGLLPGYATEGHCSLHPASDKLYLYTPMGVLVALNLLMFISTLFCLWMYRSKMRRGSTSMVGSTSTRQSWALFAKLFFVMGITWVVEVGSGLLGYKAQWTTIFDVINLLQGASIFVIFAAKRENLLWIYRKHPQSRWLLGRILKMGWCYVEELEGEGMTEMTSAEKNRTLIVTYNNRASMASMSSEKVYM